MKFIIVFITVFVSSQLQLAAAVCPAPRYSQITPSSTRATIQLAANGQGTTCQTNKAFVACVNDGSDQFQRTISPVYSLDLEDLEPDTLYTCFVRWANSPNSKPIKFRTRVIAPNQLTITNITQNSFNVSWNENYDPQFVLSNSLEIVYNGVRHIPRSDCQQIGESKTLNFDNTVFSSVFENGFPNEVFTVRLVTAYNLSVYGLHKASSTAVVYLKAAEPGAPENLAVDFRCEEEAGYNATAVISWMSPCELNGLLSSFYVTVTVSFTSRGADRSVVYSISVPALDPSHRYLYELRNIDQFYRYNVAISTVAATRSAERSIDFIPPDVCSQT